MTEPTMDDAMKNDIRCLLESGLSVEQVGALVNWLASDLDG